MKEIKITRDNIPRLIAGRVIKIHNSWQEWDSNGKMVKGYFVDQCYTKVDGEILKSTDSFDAKTKREHFENYRPTFMSEADLRDLIFDMLKHPNTYGQKDDGGSYQGTVIVTYTDENINYETDAYSPEKIAKNLKGYNVNKNKKTVKRSTFPRLNVEGMF